MLSSQINLFVLYKILAELSTPFKDTKAFELGLIDEKGVLLKSPKTKKEKEAYTYFYRFIFNIKRVMVKVGLESRLATLAASLFLLKEEHDKEFTEKEILDRIFEEMENVDETLLEDAPVNTSAAATLGGVVDWRPARGRKKTYGKPINGITYLRRKKKTKYEEIK